MNYVFIVGCFRSGTTLLRTLLGAHPELSVSPELKFWTLIYSRWRKFQPLDEEANQQRLTEAIFSKYEKFKGVIEDYKSITDSGDTGRRELLETKKNQFLEELKEDDDRTPASVFFLLVRLFSGSGGGRYIVKTPTNIQMLPAICRYLPEARFIHIYRDPRDVVTSTLFGKSSYTKNLLKVASQWNHLNRYGLEKMNALPADQYQRVKFEELVRRPEDTLNRLINFLGVSASHDLLTDATVVNSSFEGKNTGLDESVIGRYKSRLSSRQVRRIESICRRLFDEFGYRTNQPDLPRVERLWVLLFRSYFEGKEDVKCFLKNRGLFHWIDSLVSI